jgi:NAD+ kinase
MEVRMSQVLLVAYESRPDAVELAHVTKQRLDAVGIATEIAVVGTAHLAPRLNAESIVVSLGGDGTFLRAARFAHGSSATVMGVNLGRVGFLVPAQPSEIVSQVTSYLAGNAVVEDRIVLDVRLSDGTHDIAINEVVVERSQAGHMVRLKTFIGGDEFLTYSADGVLVSTPTGSTGYNFSAGGPVMATNLANMVMTPIAPHFTVDRSIVVSGATEISMAVLDRPGIVVADGMRLGSIEPGESLTICSHATPIRVALSPDSKFGARLRHSLREGHA